MLLALAGLLLCAGAAASAQAGNQSDFYMITLVRALVLHSEHFFVVQLGAEQNGLLFIDTYSSKLKDRGRGHFILEGIASVPYTVPFPDFTEDRVTLDFRLFACGSEQSEHDCAQKPLRMIATQSTTLAVLRRSLLLLTDLSKPVYKPRDEVQFRVLPLYPSMLHPDRFGLSESARRSLRVELVFLESPAGTRVAQWRNVSWREALEGFSYPLPADPDLGRWKLVARAGQTEEVDSFLVRRYVLPPFTMQIHPPPFLRVDQKVVTFRVCAQHGTQLPIKASVSAKLCLVREDLPKQPPDGIHCINATGTLDGSNECLTFRESTRGFKIKDCTFQLGRYRTFLNATVVQDGTKVALSRSARGGELTFYPFRIAVESPELFKPGLPYYGLVRTLNPDGTTVAGVRVAVSYESDHDDAAYEEQFTADAEGKIHFHLPIIFRAAETISIHFQWADYRRASGCMALRKPEAFHVVRHLFSPTGTFLQLLPLERMDTQEPCATGYLSLRLQSTVPLHDKTLSVVGTAKGVLKSAQSFGPRSRRLCRDTDDNALGHYNCTGREQNGVSLIRCLHGWSGLNCLTPVCALGCRRGVCRSRDRCVCERGWTGIACHRCLRRASCMHGVCRHGRDCVCQPGWRGFDCDKRDPGYGGPRTPLADRSLPLRPPDLTRLATEVPLQLFERDLLLRVDPTLGPGSRQVVWFLLPRPGTAPEFVATSLKLPALQPCMARAVPTSFSFDAAAVRPGQFVSARVRTSGDRPLCALSLSDAALDHFGTAAPEEGLVATLAALEDALSEEEPSLAAERRRCVLPANRGPTLPPPLVAVQDPRPPDSSEAFRAAGVHILSSVAVVTAPCPPPRHVPAHLAPREGEAGSLRDLLRRTGRLRADRLRQRGSTGQPIRAPPPTLAPRDGKKMRRSVRRYFPESWKFVLLDKPGENLTLWAPDSITTWRSRMFCVSSKGLGLSPPASLVVMQPFFIQLALPYSLVRGERVRVPVQVFSYTRSCQEVAVELPSTPRLRVSGPHRAVACICDFNQVTVAFELEPRALGWVAVEATATAHASAKCSFLGRDLPTAPPVSDTVRRRVLVEPEGVPESLSYGDLVCVRNSSASRSLDLRLPNGVLPVAESVRAYLSWSGDVVSAALPHLDHLVRLPIGCGEQNMIAMVPSVLVADYLTAGGSTDDAPELLEKAKRFIGFGYQRQLRYRRRDGSFSAFGKIDTHGSTWLTAFVLTSFARASRHAAIDEGILHSALTFLRRRTRSDGCSREDGRVVVPTLRGELSSDKDEVLISVYVLGALLDARADLASPRLYPDLDAAARRSLACVRRHSPPAGLRGISTYSLAMRAFALTRRPSLESRLANAVLTELRRRRRSDGPLQHWSATRKPSGLPPGAKPWVHVSPADVETTAYAVLAELAQPGGAASVQGAIRWLVGLRGELGGWFSTQDSLVALRAVAEYARKTRGAAAGGPNLSLTLGGQHFRVGSGDRLVLRRVQVESSSRMTLRVNGSGCVAVHRHLLFSVAAAARRGSPFRLSLRAEQSERECSSVQVTACARFLGPGESGMAILRVGMASGWALPDSEFEALRSLLREGPGGLRRAETARDGALLLYLDRLRPEATCVRLRLRRRQAVAALRPLVARLFDYYQPAAGADATTELLAQRCLPRRRRVVAAGCPICPAPADLRALCGARGEWLAAARGPGPGQWSLARPSGASLLFWSGGMTVGRSCRCRPGPASLLLHRSVAARSPGDRLVLDRSWALLPPKPLPPCLAPRVAALAAAALRMRAEADAARERSREAQLLARPRDGCPVCARDLSPAAERRLLADARAGRLAAALVEQRRHGEALEWRISGPGPLTPPQAVTADLARCGKLACSYESLPGGARLFLAVVRDPRKLRANVTVRPDADFLLGAPRRLLRSRLAAADPPGACPACLAAAGDSWLRPARLSYLLRTAGAQLLTARVAGELWTFHDATGRFLGRRCVVRPPTCPATPCDRGRRRLVVVSVDRRGLDVLLRPGHCIRLDGRFAVAAA